MYIYECKRTGNCNLPPDHGTDLDLSLIYIILWNPALELSNINA